MSTASGSPGAHSLKDRARFVALNLIGQEVEVQRADGAWLRGVLQATTAAEGLGVLLRWATAVDAPAGTRPTPSVEVAAGELVQVRARDVTLAQDQRELEGGGGGGGGGFLTDTAISNRGGGGGGRALERWVPDEGTDNMALGALEGGAHNVRGGRGGWDQFEANRQLFGVEASFDEDAYTTRLDRSDPAFRKREAEAARIAREIKRQTSTNVHVADERGQAVELSEEQLYGAVIRDASALGQGGTGKYVPPGKRAPAAAAPAQAQVAAAPAQAPAAAPAPAPTAAAPAPAPAEGKAAAAGEEGEEKPKKLSMRELLRRKKAAGTAKAFVPSAAKATAALPVQQYDASKSLSDLLCAGMATVIAIASDTGASAPDPHWPGGSTPYAQVVPTSYRMQAMGAGMVPVPAFPFAPQMAFPFAPPAAKPYYVMPPGQVPQYAPVFDPMQAQRQFAPRFPGQPH